MQMPTILRETSRRQKPTIKEAQQMHEEEVEEEEEEALEQA